MANPNHSGGHRSRRVGLPLRLLLLILTPLLIAFFLATQLVDFDPALFPEGFDSPEIAAVEKEHRSVLGNTSERVGGGLLPGPEDLTYDEKEGFIYTGCNDGWIRRFRPPAKVVEDWAYVGGQPLGVAISPGGSIVVAESYKGRSKFRDLVMKYPLLRKFLVIPAKLGRLPTAKGGGVISVDLEGRLTALFSNQDLPQVTSGLKLGRDLYLCSLTNGYILRLDLNKFGAD